MLKYWLLRGEEGWFFDDVSRVDGLRGLEDGEERVDDAGLDEYELDRFPSCPTS